MCYLKSGNQFEYLVLGECTASEDGYRSFFEAMRLARKCQPTKKTEIVEMLERELAVLVGSDVEYFTAVRTPLDYFHGVDAFFVCGGLVVTLDATINDDKHCCKADILVTYEKVRGPKAVHMLAAEIAREFESKGRRAYR